VELANDAEAYLQRMQEVLARNTFQAKRTANLQHGIEPPLGPTLKEAAPDQDATRPAPPRRILEPGDAARLAEGKPWNGTAPNGPISIAVTPSGCK
jgi:hypothetical protein